MEDAADPPPSYDQINRRRRSISDLFFFFNNRNGRFELGGNVRDEDSIKELEPWNMPIIKDHRLDWQALNDQEKKKRICWICLQVTSLIICLYFYSCSVLLLSLSFALLGGKRTSDVLRKSSYIQNPLVGMMLGLLVAVLSQNSFAATALIVTLVNTQVLTMRSAIPLVMGVNVGTSVVNTVVSLTQIFRPYRFRRAFAGATLHDMYNWLTLLLLLLIEAMTGLLEKLTGWLLDQTSSLESLHGVRIEIFEELTSPVTNLFIQLDMSVFSGWSLGIKEFENASMVRSCNETQSCYFLLSNSGMSDIHMGVILMCYSFLMIFAIVPCIIYLIRLLLRGQIADAINKLQKKPHAWYTGYFHILLGFCVTFIVQSSSMLTALLIPFTAIGLVTVDSAYPLVLGSNLGTSTIAILSAMEEGSSKEIRNSLQIALVYLFFNIFGISVYYVIPVIRLPLRMAKSLGNIATNYRWFPFLYLGIMFFVLPSLVFVVS